MKIKVRKIRGNEFSNKLCPCGSGKVYEKCCKKKKIKYEIHEDGYVKKIPMTDGVVGIIKEEEKLFKEYYNRVPDGNDFLFSFAPSFNDEILLKLIYTMRKSGIPEEKIYAVYKTDGLMPSMYNIDYISDEEIKEYKGFQDEYLKLMSEPDDKNINSLKFVVKSNSFLSGEIDYIFNALIATCNDFIHRHTNSQEALSFVTKDSLDFCVFSVLKTIKTLQSIEKLQKNHLPECIYSLGRSFFENYMYMCAINSDSEFFNQKLLPIIDDEKYNLIIEPNGKISRKKAVEKSSGKEIDIKVIIAQMKKYLNPKTDALLYEEFYQDVCKYVHVDILSAKQYYSVIDIYDQIDPTLVATVSVLSIALMLLNKISECELVDAQYQSDFKFLSNKLLEKLLDCLQIIDSDPLHEIPLVKTLKKCLTEADE